MLLYTALISRPILVLQTAIIFMLLGAFVLELQGLAKPCNLCTIQRILLIIILFFTLIYCYKSLLIVILGGNVLVSFYQLLLQYNILHTTCSINESGTISTCNIIDVSFLGMSLAAYSMIIYIILIIFILIYMKSSSKRLMP